MSEYGLYQNLLIMAFDGVGEFDIPQLYPTTEVNVESWIGFNQFNSTRKNRETTGVHFYLDDYQFERIWAHPYRYAKALKPFNTVMTPDFSTYLDFPEAVRIFNHYRRHWCGRYWQEMGINVIPNIQWGYKESYSWCFDGDPVGGIVAVSNIGMRKSKELRQRFNDGYNEMLVRLQPKKVLMFGHSFDDYQGNVEYIEMSPNTGVKSGE